MSAYFHSYLCGRKAAEWSNTISPCFGSRLIRLMSTNSPLLRVGYMEFPLMTDGVMQYLLRRKKARISILGQHRTIASASLSRLFAPLPQFRKWEIHTVFLHFRNFEVEQKPYLRLLAELCGAALVQIQCHFEHIHAADTFCLFIVYSSNLVFILCMRKAFPMHKIISLQNVVCISAWKV